MTRFTGLLAALLLISSPAYAYVDPGLLGVLYQAAYALIFGTFIALIVRPWHYIKTIFGRVTGRGTDSKDGKARAAKSDRDPR